MDSSILKNLNIPQYYIGDKSELPDLSERDPNGIYVTQDTGEMWIHGDIEIGKKEKQDIKDVSVLASEVSEKVSKIDKAFAD